MLFCFFLEGHTVCEHGKKITFKSFSWHFTYMEQNNSEVLVCHLKTSSIERHVISFWNPDIMYCQMYISTDHQSNF